MPRVSRRRQGGFAWTIASGAVCRHHPPASRRPARRNRPNPPSRWADSIPPRASGRRGRARAAVWSALRVTQPRPPPSRRSMSRPPQPEDLYRFRIPTDPQLSPDGEWIAFTVQTAAPGRDAYRQAIWLVPADGSAPARQVSIGVRHDTHPRFSPDGRSLAFLSDRRPITEEEPGSPLDREDGTQVHLLPLSGGEARRLTD